ncbi:hypothetical protein ES703_67661 [subsurface metagenome]
MTTTAQKPLAQRNSSTYLPKNTPPYNSDTILERLTYGVPTERRLLSPGIFNKKFDRIRDYLVTIDLTPSERQIVLQLLRLYAYYGKVYPKASEFSPLPGSSIRTFWRAVAKLEELGLVDRINRYLHHLQISNAYRLDKLILILARWLAEHGYPFTDKFTLAILRLTDRSFWRIIGTIKVRLRDSKPVVF